MSISGIKALKDATSSFVVARCQMTSTHVERTSALWTDPPHGFFKNRHDSHNILTLFIEYL
jgi:hypothetical protein